MKAPVQIRDEQAMDAPRIHEVTREAFLTMSYAAGTEQYIVDALRNEGLLTLSLVASLDGLIIGHIAMSPVTASWGEAGWYGLGPVSVLPRFQRQGIGSALIHAALARLRSMAAIGCVLAGDPNYYQRFGFAHEADLTIDQVPPEASLFLRFQPSAGIGVVKFHEAFFRAYANVVPVALPDEHTGHDAG